MNSIAPSLIHQESDIIKRTLRDIYDDDTKNIIGHQLKKNVPTVINIIFIIDKGHKYLT